MTLKPSVTVGLFIALDEEYTYFSNCINEKLNIKQIEDFETHPAYLINLNKVDIKLVVVCPDSMGGDDSLFATEKLLNNNDFKCFFNIGIAGSLSDDIHVGDILIPDVIDNYLKNAKITDDDDALNFILSGDPYKPNFIFYDRLTSQSKKKNGWYSEWQKDREEELNNIVSNIPSKILKLISTKPQIKGGRLASGSILAASKKLKDILKNNRDRKFLGIEMEATGVAKACHQRLFPVPFLAIKAISDPATKTDKKTLDSFEEGVFRKWGMRSATTLFIHFLDDITDFLSGINTPPKIKESSHSQAEIVSSNTTENNLNLFLNPSYKNIEIKNFDDTVRYSNYFSKTVKGEDFKGNIFKYLCKNIYSCKSEYPLNIVAEKGSGKSSFLSILYKSLCIESNDTHPVFYINFRRLLLSAKINEDIIKSTYNKIDNFLDGSINKEPILILDDIESIETRNDTICVLTGNILQKINNLNNKKIVFGSRKLITAGYPEIITNKVTPTIINKLTLSSVNKRNPHYEGLISSYIEMCNTGLDDSTCKQIKERIINLDIYNLDLFIISNIKSNIANSTYSETNTLSRYLELYCSQAISLTQISPRITLEELSQYVFKRFVMPDEVTSSHPIKLHGKIKNLIENKLTRDFLVAYYGTNSLNNYINNSNKDLDDFSYVFPDTVNHFFKEMINKKGSEQTLTLRKIEALSNDLLSVIPQSDKDKQEKHIRGLTHCAYLAGRLNYNDDSVQEYLNNVLSVLKNTEKNETIHTNKEYGLLIRTIYISLANSGAPNATDTYITRLIKNKYEDNLNRGFHLEYYGDQEYIAQYGMNHQDLLEDCNLTFTHLNQKISDHIYLNGKDDPLLDIEIHTLLSLVQNRSKSDCFKKLKEPALQLIHTLQKNRVIKNDELNSYLSYMKKFLEVEAYNYIHVLIDIYKLKSIERTGWLKNIQGPNIRLESVAEHTFGACFLAYFFLDKNSKEENKIINKDRVIKMLLIHDIAECYVGDIINKTDAEKAEERRWIDIISFVGTNNGLPDHREVADLFNEIEGMKSIEGKIANDFDKLENLIQLYLYKEHLDKADFKKFEDNLHLQITTSFVRKIRSNIEEFFAN